MELAVIGKRLAEPLTGVGRYLECLVRHWSRTPLPFDRVRIYAPGEPQWPAGTVRPPVEVVVVTDKVSPLWWENVALAAHLRRADLLFGAYTLPWLSGDRGVVSNLGIYESRPGDFSWPARLRTRPFFRRSVRRARLVLANSSSTRNDVVQYFGASPGRVRVIPLGADERLSPGRPEGRAKLPADPFFLFVGKISKRRNLPLLIEAFAAAKRSGSLPHKLVVIGPDYLGLDLPGLARAAGVGQAVVWREHAAMDELADYYRGATAFVLPTEHEGFSLTLVEAMASGAPTIVFDHAALEDSQRMAALIPAPTTEGLQEALLATASDEGLRDRLSGESILCATAFRWEETARRTMEALAEAARLGLPPAAG